MAHSDTSLRRPLLAIVTRYSSVSFTSRGAINIGSLEFRRAAAHRPKPKVEAWLSSCWNTASRQSEVATTTHKCVGYGATTAAAEAEASSSSSSLSSSTSFKVGPVFYFVCHENHASENDAQRHRHKSRRPQVNGSSGACRLIFRSLKARLCATPLVSSENGKLQA